MLRAIHIQRIREGAMRRDARLHIRHLVDTEGRRTNSVTVAVVFADRPEIRVVNASVAELPTIKPELAAAWVAARKQAEVGQQ